MRKTKRGRHDERTEFANSVLAQKVLTRVAKEFSSPEALKEYLQEHPGADRSKHHVRSPEEHSEHPKSPDHSDHSDHHEKKEPSKGLKERFKSFSDKAKNFLKAAPKEVKKFVEDESYRKEVAVKASEALEKLPEKAIRNAVDTVKHEIKEFKDAGSAVKTVLKGGKMDHHQKHALKTVAFHVGLTLAATALTVSGGPLAGMLAFGKSMSKHVAMKAASKALGNVHVLEELGHVGHGVKHLMHFASEDDSVDEEKILGQFVAKLIAQEIHNLGPEDLQEIMENSAKEEPSDE